jgi:hypothetical protein
MPDSVVRGDRNLELSEMKHRQQTSGQPIASPIQSRVDSH